jgi:hypothetical protein
MKLIKNGCILNPISMAEISENMVHLRTRTSCVTGLIPDLLADLQYGVRSSTININSRVFCSLCVAGC